MICSRDSSHSGPVLREIERAFQKEDRLKSEGHHDSDVLVPISLDNYVFDGWNHYRQADVVSKHIEDFSDDTLYDEKLDRLIDALDINSW